MNARAPDGSAHATAKNGCKISSGHVSTRSARYDLTLVVLDACAMDSRDPRQAVRALSNPRDSLACWPHEATSDDHAWLRQIDTTATHVAECHEKTSERCPLH